MKRKQSVGTVTLALIGAALGAIPAYAQDTSAAAGVSPAGSCDVAVWTGSEFLAQRFGLFPGGVLTSVGRKTDQPNLNPAQALATLLSPSVLFGIIRDSDLPDVIGKKVNYIHMDRDVKQSRADRRRKARNLPSSAPCYYEIYVTSVYYISDPIWGEKFTSFYKIRDFSSGKLKSYSGHNGAKVKNYTGSTTEDGLVKLKWVVSKGFDETIREELGSRGR